MQSDYWINEIHKCPRRLVRTLRVTVIADQSKGRRKKFFSMLRPSTYRPRARKRNENRNGVVRAFTLYLCWLRHRHQYLFPWFHFAEGIGLASVLRRNNNLWIAMDLSPTAAGEWRYRLKGPSTGERSQLILRKPAPSLPRRSPLKRDSGLARAGMKIAHAPDEKQSLAAIIGTALLFIAPATAELRWTRSATKADCSNMSR